MAKGEKYGYKTAILHLAPYTLSGKNVCPKASKECAAACLNTSGRGQMGSVQKARLNKTNLFWKDRKKFLEDLSHEIGVLKKRAASQGFKFAVRLNGTSDLAWYKLKMANGSTVIDSHPDVQFYDYTKIPTRKIEGIDNYHLTWSYSEANQKYAEYFDTIKYNIAVVFNTKVLPIFWKGKEVIDGDESDLRFLDKQNVVVGLKAKGKAKQDMSGFVIHLA